METFLAELGQPAFWLAALQIIWINVLLSGDNAVVIALACRMLPAKQRLWGMILGAGVAVVLRIIFTGIVAQLMAFPFLKLVGGLLLLWIAIKLVVPDESHGEGKVEAADNLWRAVRIVAIADIVMSLDNVIAIAGAAETAGIRIAAMTMAADAAHVASVVKITLITFGLATSIPLIIAGSAILMAMIDRFPILVWAGAGLLGWVAGEIIIKDAAVAGWLGSEFVHRYEFWSASAGVVFVIGIGWLLARRRRMAQSEV
ncbi:MAG: YjbE family putative metal transport protein [Rhizobiales bacterium]|nr:YjbE family putative metal transport protein [Hyphomicrobiales bacterium]